MVATGSVGEQRGGGCIELGGGAHVEHSCGKEEGFMYSRERLLEKEMGLVQAPRKGGGTHYHVRLP